MIEDNNRRLTLSAHRVVEEVLIGQSDAVFKFCLVGLLRQAQDRPFN